MNIGIYIYDDAEVLDFSGPFEVFSTANRLKGNNWNIFFVADTDSIIKARGNFLISPHHTIKNHPGIDILLVAGGIHNKELNKKHVIDWIKKVSDSAKKTASVCTGAFFLAKAGLLKDLSATTHWEDILDLKKDYPDLDVKENIRYIDEGQIITSAGISAGIDMSLYLVSHFASIDLAKKTARQMEYDWKE